MSEPTLASDYADLRSRVGHFLGYQRDSSAWTTAMTDDIDACLKSGLRMVYSAYDWSFLKPVARLTLASAANVVDLPDDYAYCDGPIQVSVAGEATTYRELALGPWQAVYQAENRSPDQTGCPLYLCEEATKGTTISSGQRSRLRVFPTADAAYQLTLAYRLNADALNASLPYAYGGAQHAELFLQSCKAAAERDIDDVPPTSPQAVHFPSFQQMLKDAVALDRRKKPQTVGWNRDLSDRMHRRDNAIPRPLLPVLVQGVQYD